MLVDAPSKLLFISGQVARDRTGRTVGVGNMTAQAEQVFANLDAILAEHGATFANAVKVTIFVTDMSRAAEVARVRLRRCKTGEHVGRSGCAERS